MTNRRTSTRDSIWTGDFLLALVNARNSFVGDAELSIRPDTVILRFNGQELGNLDRDRLRDWLLRAYPAPLILDAVRWSTECGLTYIGSALGDHSARPFDRYRVDAESLADLIGVI